MIDHTKFWRIPNYHALTFLHATYSTYAFPKHLHETYVIEMVLQGMDRFFCDGKTYNAAAGSIVIINPYEVHTGQSVGAHPLIYRSLYPSIALMHDLLGELELTTAKMPLFHRRVLREPGLFHKLLQVHQAFEFGEDQLACDTLLCEAFSGLVRTSAPSGTLISGKNPPPRQSMQRAQAYLHENLAEKITLHQLAQVAEMSSFHLLRTFCDAFGISPHEYLTNLRIERAKRMIAERKPLAQVACETGFCDQSHFSRHFKRLVGMTPGQYAQV